MITRKQKEESVKNIKDKLSKANKLLGRKEFAMRKEMEELSEKLTVDF